MNPDHAFTTTPRVQAAFDELADLILARYPDATFEVEQGEDPDAFWLVATAAFYDRDDIVDLYLDRLVDLRVEEGLPIFVLAQRTPECEAAVRAEEEEPALAPAT